VEIRSSDEFIRLRLRRARADAELTQAEASELAKLSESYLRGIEVGQKRNVPTRTLDRLLRVYGLTFEKFFTGCRLPARAKRKKAPDSPHYRRRKPSARRH